MPEGRYLFLPVFGPSGPRDAVGLGVNAAMDPFTWVGQGAAVRALDWSRFGMNALDQRERHLDDIDSIKKTALDPYATFRSLYRQHRQSADRERSQRQACHNSGVVSPIRQTGYTSPIRRPVAGSLTEAADTPCQSAALS